jgi:glycosyltransferase involved in cell wall biosynthesis
MRILFKGMYFYPEVGGMEVHILNLARGFIRIGDEVEVIASNSIKSQKQEIYDDIIIIRTPFFGKSLLGWFLATIFSLPIFLKRAKQADLIHGHDIASIIPGVLGKIFYRKPFVLTLHSSHFIKLSGKLLFKTYFKFGIKRADYVFAASKEIKNIAQDLVPSKRIEALINPVDTELFSPKVKPSIDKKDDELILVCPRRLVEKNGVHFLIEAMPKIISRKKEAKLILVGDGPLRQEIEKRIKELEIEKKVVLLGTVPNEILPGILASADLIVIPSLMEATSVAALESMACGKAIAASRVGGLPEIIDENIGFLMEPGNPDSIAKKINIALNDIGLLKKKGKIARERVVNNWSASRSVKKHRKIFESVVENGKC